jgi:prepilin signal peptidase PulO-like enzyme (type II secretory pathway)
MYTIVFIAIFILGTIIGSFLNVVIYRFNTGKSITRGRSICMSCNRTLMWYELIPVLSFLISSGKCRRCRSIISHQYPLVEIISGLMFVLVSYHFLPILSYSQGMFITLLVASMSAFSLLLVITVYDIRHKIIPDPLVYAFIVVSFVFMFINQTPGGSLFTLPSVTHILAGPALAIPFALLWLLSRGKAMGLGDAKLILGIGFMLGMTAGLAALILAFWTGSVVGILALFMGHRKFNVKSEIPFAPFLALGAVIAFLFNLTIFSLAGIFI